MIGLSIVGIARHSTDEEIPGEDIVDSGEGNDKTSDEWQGLLYNEREASLNGEEANPGSRGEASRPLPPFPRRWRK